MVRVNQCSIPTISNILSVVQISISPGPCRISWCVSKFSHFGPKKRDTISDFGNVIWPNRSFSMRIGFCGGSGFHIRVPPLFPPEDLEAHCGWIQKNPYGEIDTMLHNQRSRKEETFPITLKKSLNSPR